MEVRRFEVYLISLDATIGKEIKKTRPCVVISPDDMNEYLSTFIVAPMTTKSRNYPSRVSCKFQSKSGDIVLDQIRTVSNTRFVKKLGSIDSQTQRKVLNILRDMFEY